MARESGSRFPVVFSLTALAQTVLWQGDIKLAHEQLDEALALAHEIEDGYCTAITFVQMGELARVEQDYARARSLFDESLALCRDLHEWEDTCVFIVQAGLPYAPGWATGGGVPLFHAKAWISMARGKRSSA